MVFFYHHCGFDIMEKWGARYALRRTIQSQQIQRNSHAKKRTAQHMYIFLDNFRGFRGIYRYLTLSCARCVCVCVRFRGETSKNLNRMRSGVRNQYTANVYTMIFTNHQRKVFYFYLAFASLNSSKAAAVFSRFQFFVIGWILCVSVCLCVHQLFDAILIHTQSSAKFI